MKLANCEPHKEALFEGFKTPGKSENCQLLFKPPSLNYFVTEALQAQSEDGKQLRENRAPQLSVL